MIHYRSEEKAGSREGGTTSPLPHASKQLALAWLLAHGDDIAPIDVVAHEPRTIERAPALSNSFGFGGINACLILKAA